MDKPIILPRNITSTDIYVRKNILFFNLLKETQKCLSLSVYHIFTFLSCGRLSSLCHSNKTLQSFILPSSLLLLLLSDGQRLLHPQGQIGTVIGIVVLRTVCLVGFVGAFLSGHQPKQRSHEADEEKQHNSDDSCRRGG